MASQSRSTSSGPFTSARRRAERRVAVIGVQLVLRFRCFCIASKAHPVHVSSLSGQATRACIRPVIRDDRGGCGRDVPVSRRLSAHRHSLLGPSCARRGVGPPSRSADRTEGPDPDGVVTFHTVETRPGGCSLNPGAAVFSAAGSESPAVACRFAAASPAPSATSHLRGYRSRGIHQEFAHSPVRPSPRLWRPDGAGALGLLPYASDPAVTSNARQGGDRPLSTGPELHDHHRRSSTR